jgi:UDP-N-acetylmuramate dehydrogenase
MKISAAWLVEKSGFPRGYRKGGVGISDNHSLALVNRGGTTRELLELAAAIEAAVLRRFGLHLQREPVLLQ